jgi:PAS domain S-box-containing protein
VARSKTGDDISVLKQAEAVAAHLAAIVTSSSDAIISKTLDGIITTWNASAQRLFGYAADEIIGQPIRRLIPPDRQAEEDVILTKLRAGERIEHFETMRVRKDGRLIEVSLTISPVKNREGQIIGVSKIGREISERKQAELRLKKSEEGLKALAGSLEVLVEHRTAELTLSQERLRALASELNLTEQRERQKLASDLHDYLAQLLSLIRIKLDLMKHHAMEEGVARLLTELQDLTARALTYTRTLVTQLSPPALEEFGLNMALQWLATQMQERNLNVVIQTAEIPSLPEDHGLLLFQSVRELLMNCVKHAQVRQATLTVAYLNGSLRITVSDQGVGFDLGTMSAPVKTGGPMTQGFGLFSIHERMHSLGGQFDLTTAPGKGTVATLVLPIVNVSEPAVHNDQMSDASDKLTAEIKRRNGTRIRVLLADDHAIVRQGVSGLLSGYGDIEVVGQATNGEEAVEMGKRLQPDVFVMDITMPKLDGIEATRKIKKQQPDAVVIGLSVNNLPQVAEAMKKAGAVALLNKETAVEELYATIRAFKP